MSDIISIVPPLVQASIRMAVPLMLTALGAVACENSGVVNIGLEGSMLCGAFAAVVATYFSGNPWLGLLAAVSIGILLGLLYALFCVTFRANQIVIGLGVNMLGSGGTTFLLQAIFGVAGISPQVKQLPTLSIPVVRDIPLVGAIVGEHNVMVYLALCLVFLIHVLLFHTPIGLHMRAVGQQPEAADTAGIDVFRIRYLGYMLSGALAALGGAYLSIGQLNFFAINMTDGRGFIALAANVFGKWMPFGVFGATAFFGFTDALRMRLLQVNIAPQFIQMIPFVVTLLVLMGFIGGAVSPAALGKPYSKE